MAKINSFEELEIWKKAVELCEMVYIQTNNISLNKDFALRDQLRKSAISVPSNIAEGFERESQKECVKFLSYAKGSCGELRCQIYIGMEIGYIPTDVGKKWIQETVEISSMISGLIKTKRGWGSVYL